MAKIKTLVAKTMTENEIPGYALGIVKDGKIVYTQGFGVERVGGDKPVTPHTVFGTGSVGKTATATAIMQLVAEGKIDLDAPVTHYLPYFKLGDEPARGHHHASPDHASFRSAGNPGTRHRCRSSTMMALWNAMCAAWTKSGCSLRQIRGFPTAAWVSPFWPISWRKCNGQVDFEH